MPPLQFVGWVDCQRLWAGGRRQLIGAAEHQFANEFLEGPTILHEFVGQVVQQLRMAGRTTRHTKVIDSVDNAFAKQVLPDAVHDYSRRQRVAGFGQPHSQLIATAASRWYGLAGQVIQHAQKASRHRGSELFRFAANTNLGIGGLGHVSYAQSDWATLSRIGQCNQFGLLLLHGLSSLLQFLGVLWSAIGLFDAIANGVKACRATSTSAFLRSISCSSSGVDSVPPLSLSDNNRAGT